MADRRQREFRNATYLTTAALLLLIYIGLYCAR